ncbi:FadR/GntR family transcriptional regulator [Bacillus sp. JCM 19034]|uniref:FadR/GntR family transcriptional regulator n=1 Tax=Bacillus sp. JCM 19034 TaxID=1481928 RepID=UPI000B2BBB46|nr:FadR/GntR family transcriptional regulator [Bacillus sp. JCM 19034]
MQSVNYKVQKRKLVDQVLAHLQSIILSRKYKVGDKLPTEPELMEMFNVGRSTVREAVKILVHANVLEVRQGDGTYVISLPVESFERSLKMANKKEIDEVRSMLEVQISALAAERRTEEDLLTMRENLDKRNAYLKNGEYSNYVKYDIAFHFAIGEASHNSLLITMYQTLSNELHHMLSTLILDIEAYKDNTHYHENLYKAINDQKVDDAKFWAEVNIRMK